MKKAIHIAVLVALAIGLLSSCEVDKKETQLPKPEADQNTQFSVDKNINQKTIDNYLGRTDVAYRDVRMLFDPAEYSAIGGEADLTQSIKGFKIVPYPFLGTLQSLPVANAYEGEKLFEVVWTQDGHVQSAKALYEESLKILEELFPKDKAIFLMCGGGGYANMTKELLLFLGWDKALLYNIGANWEYQGNNALYLLDYSEDKDGNNVLATWRADYAYIEFDKLHKVK